MGEAKADWFDRLPTNRLIAEFSAWSADQGRIAEDVARTEPFVDLWHVDACDGHFAPSLLLFPDQTRVIRQLSMRPIHVHLMVKSEILLAQIDQFREAGADLISVHIESDADTLDGALARIAQAGLKAGLAVTLETPVDAIRPYLERLDFLTMMGTPIGIKGVSPDENTYARLSQARRMLDGRRDGRRIILAADGGIRETTVARLGAAGADTVVMGSLAFGASDVAARMAWLHSV